MRVFFFFFISLSGKSPASTCNFLKWQSPNVPPHTPTHPSRITWEMNPRFVPAWIKNKISSTVTRFKCGAAVGVLWLFFQQLLTSFSVLSCYEQPKIDKEKPPFLYKYNQMLRIQQQRTHIPKSRACVCVHVAQVWFLSWCLWARCSCCFVGHPDKLV